MSYSIEVSEDGRYIIQKYVGEINRQISIQKNVEAHALGNELGIDCFLVDLTEAVNTDTTMDSYEWAYTDMSEMPAINQHARVSFLVSPDDHSHDFIETVARNTGLNVEIFKDRQEAIDHLLTKRTSGP